MTGRKPTTGLPILAARDEETEYRLHRRFDRLGRLYGDGAVQKLMGSKVLVVGLGGVGSFAAEALARSAVGHIMLVDFDDVCVTNTNRQLQALKGNVGLSKAVLLQDRLCQVNPQAIISSQQVFYNAERSAALLTCPWGAAYDFVVDCIDNITAKAHLLSRCCALKLPVVSSMGAAAKQDPTRVRIHDLEKTYVCPMAREMRGILRKKYDFPRRGAMGIPAVYSDEPRIWPRELTYDHGQGFRCVCPKKSNEHSCDSRTLIDGTAVFVTGAFGLACASYVVRALVGALPVATEPAPTRKLSRRQRSLQNRRNGGAEAAIHPPLEDSHEFPLRPRT